MSIITLPELVIHNIGMKLDYESIKNLKCSSKTINNLIDKVTNKEYFWKEKLEHNFNYSIVPCWWIISGYWQNVRDVYCQEEKRVKNIEIFISQRRRKKFYKDGSLYHIYLIVIDIMKKCSIFLMLLYILTLFLKN